jgi:hypothetical protein
VMIRELVPGTLQVYPVKDYGAIEMGVHRFHHPGHEKEWPPVHPSTRATTQTQLCFQCDCAWLRSDGHPAGKRERAR